MWLTLKIQEGFTSRIEEAKILIGNLKDTADKNSK